MQNRILVLEGVPASGKTSLANLLRDDYGALKVNESTGRPARHSGNQRAIFQETVERYSWARESSGLVVIDRGYPSLLAWDYCRERTEYEFEYSRKLLWIRAALADGSLFEPFQYVYLRVTVKTSFQRRPRPHLQSDAWSDQRGVRLCIEYYNRFFSRPAQQSRTISVDGNQSTKRIAMRITRQLSL